MSVCGIQAITLQEGGGGGVHPGNKVKILLNLTGSHAFFLFLLQWTST